VRRRLPVLLAVLALVACGDDGGSTDVASSGDCPAEITEALERWAGAGFSGAVAVSGPVACFLGVGPASDVPSVGHVFGIGSVSKTLTGVAIASLVEDGVLSLDDRAGTYLPELTGPAAAVTIEQLLAHTSGLGGGHGPDEEPMTLDEALDAIDDQELRFEPGSDRAYSNSGYTLLAAIVERAADRPFRDFMDDEVLTVGGVRLGGFSPDEPAWAVEGNGSMAFSARQLHDWTRALVAGEVLGPDGLALMTAPLLPADGPVTEGPGWARLDESVLGEVAFGSAGGGGDTSDTAVLLWFPEIDAVVVVVADSDSPNAETLAQEIVPALVAGDDLPVPVEGDDVDPEVLRAAAGSFEAPDGSVLEVTAVDDELAVVPDGGQAMLAIFPAPGGVTEHEAAVAAFYQGTTDEGADEVAIVEDDIGSIESVAIVGSAFVENELRTFVHIEAARGSLDGWVAIDDDGNLAAIDYGQPLPDRRFVAQGRRSFVAADTPADDAVTIELARDGSMITVRTGDLSVSAQRR
jgi:CubicO group peptidase (beta-lactamase class C family)